MSKKEKLNKLKKEYQQLEELFHEASSILTDELTENRELHAEMKYLKDFIVWKSLSEEYDIFRKEAYLDPSEELPFPRYIM